MAPLVSVAPATAQSGTSLPAIIQPAEKTKAGYLARARALRDQAVKDGDQAYGAVVVRDGVIVGEGRNLRRSAERSHGARGAAGSP